jgi:hypothetical protein
MKGEVARGLWQTRHQSVIVAGLINEGMNHTIKQKLMAYLSYLLAAGRP